MCRIVVLVTHSQCGCVCFGVFHSNQEMLKKKFLGRLSAKKGKQENNMYICYELYVIFDRSNYCRHMERENKNKSIQFISTGMFIFYIT